MINKTMPALLIQTLLFIIKINFKYLKATMIGKLACICHIWACQSLETPNLKHVSSKTNANL